MSKKNLTLEELQNTSYLSGSNANYIEDLYDAFLENPNSVDDEWRGYFTSMRDSGAGVELSHRQIIEQFRTMARQPSVVLADGAVENVQQYAVDEYIHAFRTYGHHSANTNPLIDNVPLAERLTLGFYGLNDADLSKTFNTRGVLKQQTASLKDIKEALQRAYMGTVASEYMYIEDLAERAWLQDYIEHKLPQAIHSKEVKLQIYKDSVASEGLEKYLDSRYPGQKRFSIEGLDALIPMLNQLAYRAHSHDVKELVLSMAHRGRVNVLFNVLGQMPGELFNEFEGIYDGNTSGDVKYHRGFSSDVKVGDGSIHLSLCFNPSHLEFIAPVSMGSVRARQEYAEAGEDKRDYAMPIIMHGDAAFAGEGVVMETLAMSQTRAYTVGGSIHIIKNNNIGFTTSNPHDARSSNYSSDLAKLINAPVFHVNADDVEAVVHVTHMALDYRMRFHKDVVIDLVGYRRHGHQEQDEPRATQPLMYQHIKAHQTERVLYEKQLIDEGVITQEQADNLWEEYRDKLENNQPLVETVKECLSDLHAKAWQKYLNTDWREAVDTSVDKNTLLALGKKFSTYPEGFTLQRNVQMVMDARVKMASGEMPMNWGFAETMAYATLLESGVPIRLSGQDVRRGTFFHRQGVLIDQKTGDEYMPLVHLGEEQANFQLYDSLLCESGALGFEYGYATASPQSLVMWEAQFGDFANVAQVYMDQFISSAWQKWNRLSGLVMLLPHGYEGMGPEHSSARLERYLQLCAQNNMQVFVPTTPSQIFHLLRRQVLRPYRKPLIVMSPKSLLGNKLCVSTLDDLANGQLQLIIPEVDDIKPADCQRVILCSGRVYYDLLQKRRDENIKDIAIIRIEQLYPFPYEEVKTELAKYKNAKEFIWCQEEPKNQGAWFCCTNHRIRKCMPIAGEPVYVGRVAMAAPAAGHAGQHKKEQALLVDQALGLQPLNDPKQDKE